MCVILIIVHASFEPPVILMFPVAYFEGLAQTFLYTFVLFLNDANVVELMLYVSIFLMQLLTIMTQ